MILLTVACVATANAQGLKEAIGKYCLIGAAVNQWQSDGQVPEADAVIDKHFNCAVAENLKATLKRWGDEKPDCREIAETLISLFSKSEQARSILFFMR